MTCDKRLSPLAPPVQPLPPTLVRGGRWQEAIEPGDTWHHLLTDTPYSEVTHEGQRSGDSRPRGRATTGRLVYEHWTRADVVELVLALAPRTPGWWVQCGDHLTTRWALSALRALGWATYQPVAWVVTDAAPRFDGRGPSSSVQWIAVAHPRTKLRRGEARFRPGHYIGPGPRRDAAARGLVGSKPEWLAAALVLDYSERGDRILDPCAGSGTFIEAARIEGREAFGCELDEARARQADRRARGAQPRWVPELAPFRKQSALAFEDEDAATPAVVASLVPERAHEPKPRRARDGHRKARAAALRDLAPPAPLESHTGPAEPQPRPEVTR